MTFSSDQDHLFRERTQALCRELDCSLERLLASLQAGDPTVLRLVAERLSTNYTFFGREPEMFAYLAEHVLPTLPSGPLRLWSAATSSGDEAYTLAVTCLEHLGPDARERVRVLGTDISERQLQLAERGVYPREQTQLLDALHVQRWFSPAGSGLRAGDTLRAMCTFRRLNLTQPSYPFTRRFHLIMLRNVLYYFDADTRMHVMESCYDAAEDGAFLLTSFTEPLVDFATRWRAVRPGVFRRVARR